MKNTLSTDLLHELFEYKDGTLIRKIQKSSRALKGQRAGRLHPNGYRYVSINKINYLEHRIIFAMHHNYWPETVDHIDLNKSNNLLSNLRAATHQQNCFNRPIRKDNKSGCSGVIWNKQYQKWNVRVVIDGKRKFLGRFENFEVAKTIANSAKLESYREFANV